jgi:signal transduction histidine kinase
MVSSMASVPPDVPPGRPGAGRADPGWTGPERPDPGQPDPRRRDPGPPAPERHSAVRLRVGAVLAAALRAPVSGRTGRALGYCIAGLPLGLAGFGAVLALVGAGTGLALTVVGVVPGLALLVVGLGLARSLGGGQRWLARRLLQVQLPRPPPRPRRTGIAARLDSALRDGASWRAVAYVALRFPLCVLGCYVVVVCWAYGLFLLTYPIWWSIAGGPPRGHDRPGLSSLRSPLPAGGLHVATIGGAFLLMLLAIPLLLVAPWLTRGVARADAWLLTRLLAPADLAARVAELERTRALAVDDAAARLRKVERDLHDGTQARLAALALTLGLAREKLDSDGAAADPDRARALVESAHLSAKQALVELRDLARGIHPPVLDNGLPDALATLVTQAMIPIRLATDIAERPTPAIETIAYFCAAELLANIVKHSSASTGLVEAVQRGRVLVLRVADNGQGGAQARPGSGLSGLAERVQTVDGSIAVESPAGGPTVVTVELPMHA